MLLPRFVEVFLRLFFKINAVVLLLACQSAQTSESTLQKVVKKYGSEKFIKIELVKSTTVKLLNRTEKSKGHAFLSGKNKLRLEFTDPLHTVAVLNGRRAWVVEYPPKDSDEKIRVSKFKIDTTPGQSQLLITSLLGSGNLLNNFKVKKMTNLDGVSCYELIPKKSMEEIKSLSVSVDEKKNEISELKYSDPIDNETVFNFVKTEFGVKLDPSLFKYEAPKGAEVNQF